MFIVVFNFVIYKFNYMMFRIRDFKVFFFFYEKVFGMKVNNFYFLLYNENWDLISSRFFMSFLVVILLIIFLFLLMVLMMLILIRKVLGISFLIERVFLSFVIIGVLVSCIFYKYFGSFLLNLNIENDVNFKGYVFGNEEFGWGFGYICIIVDNFEVVCKWFDEFGVRFKKRFEEGRMRVSEISFYFIGRGVFDL